MRGGDPVSPLSAQSPFRTQIHGSNCQQIGETLILDSGAFLQGARGEAWRALGQACGLIVDKKLWRANPYESAWTRKTLECAEILWS